MILLHHMIMIHILLLPHLNKPSSCNNNINGLINNTRPRFTFQSPLTPERTSVTTHPYTQAQKTSDPNLPTTCNINIIHTNPPSNIVTSRTLCTPPIQTIPYNPLQYNLSSTNTHNKQHTICSREHITQTVTSYNSVQHHNVSVPSSSSIKTNPYFTPISQSPANTNNLQTTIPHSNYHITHPYAQPSTTISNPTYINSLLLFQKQSNRLMALILNIRLNARVTFSLGLQRTTSKEYKFWHARRMTFIQCSLTNTALSWYIRSLF